jgi:hypothetical protein
MTAGMANKNNEFNWLSATKGLFLANITNHTKSSRPNTPQTNPNSGNFQFVYFGQRLAGGHFEGRSKKSGDLDRFKNKYGKNTQEINGRMNRIFNQSIRNNKSIVGSKNNPSDFC